MPFEVELRSLGIELPSYEIGRYDALCPRCSYKRRKNKLKCLGITIEADKFFGGCNHCNWTFPEKGFRSAQKPQNNANAGVFHAYGADLRKYKNPPGREPRFYWRHRVDQREWKAGTGGIDTATLLYRIDEVRGVMDRGPVLIVEGERDVDTCFRLGFAATCNAHGASEPGKRPKWTDAHSAQLRGGKFVVLNDNDAAGYAHAEATCRSLIKMTNDVRRLDLKDEWPSMPEHADITDWAAGHVATDLQALIAKAKPYVPSRPPQPPQPPPPTGWLALCIMSDARIPRPMPVLHNACLGLENDPAFVNKLTFDEMARKPLVTTSETKFVEDEDIALIQRKLQTLGLRNLSKDIAAQAIEHVARQRSFHPLRDYLDGLTWDGIERIDEWLPTYLGSENTDYTRCIGRLFLIQMVTRIYDPGCKADYMLILEGPQGEEKSKACAALAGAEYFSDHLPDLTNAKDVSVHLRGKWLIEVPELHAFSKAEATLLKSFLSRQRELFRPPYGRMEVDEPRQCVFIGTSNKDTYLRDETGGRRFWPVKCGAILVDSLTTDRDQLLAEAVWACKRGVKAWPDKEFERQHIRPQQDSRYEADVWSEAVEDHLQTILLADKTTVRAIARAALGIEDKMMDARTEKRIVSVLQRLGWTRSKSGGTRYWHRPQGH